MYADTTPTGILANEFAVISTSVENSDNGKIYRWTGSTWDFIADISGTTTHSELVGLQGGVTGERYHLDSAQHAGLTGGTSTAVHYHSADRDRGLHTGVQTASTISDFETAVKAIILDGGYY